MDKSNPHAIMTGQLFQKEDETQFFVCGKTPWIDTDTNIFNYGKPGIPSQMLKKNFREMIHISPEFSGARICASF